MADMQKTAPKLMKLPLCPACRCANRKHLFAIPDSNVYECSSCTLRYLDPCLDPTAMKEAYESEETLKSMHEFHEGYYDYGDLKTPSRTLRDFQKGLDILEKAIPKGKILDVGFGNGLFLAAAKERGWQVQGIDSSSSNLETAKKKFGLGLTRSSWEDFNSQEKFDAIAFWDVIEHLPDPNAAFQKVRTHLKDNGVVLVALPNDAGFLTWLACLFHKLGMKRNLEKIYLLEHVCYYKLETLNPLLQNNGFRLSGYFHTSTDLAKYALPAVDKAIASAVLGVGTLLGRQNRLVAVFQKLPA